MNEAEKDVRIIFDEDTFRGLIRDGIEVFLAGAEKRDDGHKNDEEDLQDVVGLFLVKYSPEKKGFSLVVYPNLTALVLGCVMEEMGKYPKEAQLVFGVHSSAVGIATRIRDILLERNPLQGLLR